jgi:hypothetical protein
MHDDGPNWGLVDMELTAHYAVTQRRNRALVSKCKLPEGRLSGNCRRLAKV